ncbi:MAG TPA: DUF427 domain-containing protein [Acidimicrobiales bacterium]|nr:DUF427 domain-containing protein [Acidimicrobiales bacterium]
MNLPVPRLEPSPRWVRVRSGDQWVADSRRALLLARYGPGMLPTYCFPPRDVRADLLAGLGDAAVQLRELPAPVDAANGMWTFAWDGRVQWFEEATEVFVHAKDTAKRVDVVPSERHVRVEIAGELVADSRRPHALFETTLPTRWYLPAEDVRRELLEPSDTVSECPYKGTARYWSVRAGGRLHRDVVWSYPEPVPECPRIAGLVCFFNEKVDLTIDGEPQSRPQTPWS